MGKEPCESRKHFAKCITDVNGRPKKVTWKCDHCGKHIISGQFKAATARVHLDTEKTNGLCAKLCDSQDDGAQARREQFRTLIKELKAKKDLLCRKRKQRQIRLQKREADAVASAVAKKRAKSKQPKLKSFLKENNAAAADHAVAQWAIAHGIPAHAMEGLYWKEMNKKLANVVSSSYKPMNRHKLYDKMLPQLKKMAEQELKEHLKHRPDVGRSLTGDGATKSKVPLVDFLVHVPGKGVKLINIIDCTDHLAEGGVKDAMYVPCIVC